MSSPLIIRGVVDRFEEKLAVIKTSKGTEIFWPIKELPNELTTGQAVQLTLTTNFDDSQERQALAKSMLNEILNNAPSQENSS